MKRFCYFNFIIRKGTIFLVPSVCRQKRLYLIVKTKLIGTEGARLLREKRVQGRPRRRRGGSRTARGKRVPGVEINVRIFLVPFMIDSLNF
ncbi:UNVERIFIED_ORG: hypothetical protein ABIC97_003523 [Peribacillus simplex]